MIRWARRAAVAASIAAATAGTTSSARAQGAPGNSLERPRFEILAVGDSTFTFAVGSRGWVGPHARGDAVDPRKRNQLVARFEVLGVNGGVATALITGQTTRVTMGDVALLDAPRRPFYRVATFWGGVAAGVIAGAAIAVGTQ